MYSIGSFNISEPGGGGDIIIPPHPYVYSFWSKSTQLCIEELEKQNLKSKTVLDLGTGTGILAVVCAKLGAKKVYATETDPVALQIAKHTFDLNNVKIDLSDVEYPNIRVDFCVANIGAETLQDNRHRILAEKILTVNNSGQVLIYNA